jgi:hypothetical protein
MHSVIWTRTDTAMGHLFDRDLDDPSRPGSSSSLKEIEDLRLADLVLRSRKSKEGRIKGLKDADLQSIQRRRRENNGLCRLYSISLVKHDITQYTKTRNSTTL